MRRIKLSDYWREKATELKAQATQLDFSGDKTAAENLRSQSEIYKECANDLEHNYPRQAWDVISI